MTRPGGEFDLIAEITEAVRPTLHERVVLGGGDDAAIVLGGPATAVSIDTIVAGVHFDLAWASAAEVGHKALATALSDLAAMGAVAGEAYVSLGLPPEHASDAVPLGLGLRDLALETGTALVGGDIVRSPVLFVTVAVAGHAEEPEGFIRRGGGRPGDLVVVTGKLGAAAAGLALATADAPPALPDQEAGAVRTRLVRPMPRLAAGAELAAAGASAMIDISDGLLADAGHLADASGVAVQLRSDSIPVDPAAEVAATALSLEPLELALAGGEDYELLAAIPEAALAAATGPGLDAAGLTVIGELAGGSGVWLDRVRQARRGHEHLPAGG